MADEWDDMPMNLDEQYRAIRETAGLVELTGHEVLQVTGKDRVRFLHGLLSNDIKSLKAGQGCLAAMLNHQGKTLAVMQVLCREEDFLLFLPPGLLERVTTHLRRYIISDQVELVSRPGHDILFTIQGPWALKALLACLGLPVEGNPYHHFQARVGKHLAWLLISDRSGRGGADLMVSSEDATAVLTALLEVSKSPAIVTASLEVLNLHRIEAGISWYGVDADETNLPMEAGFEHALNFKKGCYLGQEIIARATFRGQLNRRLMGLILEGDQPASRGAVALLESKEVGRVTSSIFSPALTRPVALAQLRREVWAEGMELQVKLDAGPVKAKVAELPFVKPAEE